MKSFNYRNLWQVNWRSLILAVLFILALIATLNLGHYFVQKEPLQIAVATGMSGDSEGEGQEILHAAQMYIDRVNQTGGVNGRPLKLVPFDDKDDAKVAPEKAKEIAQKTQALVVLGHNYSSTSIPAGKIYKQFGVPVISGSATADEVTEGNEWYFRVVVDNSLQGSFLANYIQKVMNQPKATLIYDAGEAYSKSMATAFEQNFLALNGQIQYKRTIDGEAKNLDQQVENIVAELLNAKPEDVGVIFLPLVEEPSAKLIIAMRRKGLFYPVIGGDTLSGGSTFFQIFEKYPEERQQPGFFTDGIQAISHIIYDVLGEEGQQFKNRYIEKYGTEPSWLAGGYYNAAKVAVEAIKLAKIEGKPATLTQDRQKIRDALASINSIDKAIAGIDGPIFFNQDGNIVKPAAIGTLSGRQLISAFTQLNPIATPKTPLQLEQGLKKGRIVQVGSRYLYKTNVVYTGMKIYEIGKLDLDQKTYDLDFNIWFRYQGNLDINNIEFLNAVQPIKLGKPIEVGVKGGLNYRLYNVKGTFRADFLPNRNFGEHLLGVSFINNELAQNNLIYVIDVIGLGDADGKSYVQTLKNSDVLNKGTGWTIDRASFFQDRIQKESQGELNSVSVQSRGAKYSRFNLALAIVENKIDPWRVIPLNVAIFLLVASVILNLLLVVLYRYRQRRAWAKTNLVLQSISIILLLFALQTALIGWLNHKIDQSYLEIILIIFNVLWWLIPAFIVDKAIDVFFWKQLEEKTGQKIPTLVHRMLNLVIYSLAIFGVIAYVFKQPITSLLATSGLALTIIGLAIQINISNIFSGLAINLEKAFQVGDYIEVYGGDNIAENITGYVVDINWRATRIRTSAGNIVLIPNSAINDKTVINYMMPEKISRATIAFCLAHNVPTDKAIYVLNTAVQAVAGKGEKSPLAEPEPEVIIGEATSIGVNYHVRCWHIPSEVSLEDIRHTVTESVLTHLQQDDIKLAYGD